MAKYNPEEKFNTNWTLDEMVQAVHKKNCEASKWSFSPLKKLSYGYENLAVCIGNYLTKTPLGRIAIAEQIHESWIENYIYWRDNMHKHPEFIPPYTPLGDERRNTCAVTAFKDLPQDEQNKDFVLADILVNLDNIMDS
jgi:hypothetical protein